MAGIRPALPIKLDGRNDIPMDLNYRFLFKMLESEGNISPDNQHS